MFHTNSAHVNYLKEFIYRHSLHVAWDHTSAQMEDTCVSHSLHQSSCIDHFIITDNLFECILMVFMI